MSHPPAVYLPTFYTMFTKRHRKDDVDESAAQQRHWFDKEPWATISKFSWLIIIIGGFAFTWVRSVNEVKRTQPVILAALQRIEYKQGIQNENTHRLATAYAIHTGHEIVLEAWPADTTVGMNR